jgi:DNA-binding beta-propeller fold protein YncE
MYLTARRGLVCAALIAIAGCSGGTAGQAPSLVQSNASSSFIHRGVPFIPGFVHNVVHRETGSSYPTKKSLVFEGDQAEAAVNIYQTAALASNPAPIATIHVAQGCPYGLALDKKGTLYVADNCFSGDVEEYAKGSTTLKTTITDGISYPLGLAIDKSGTLYVSCYPPAIVEYANGSTSPTKTITGGGMSDPFGLALDSAGNLYIADFGASAVFELPAGGSSVTNLGLANLGEPIGVAYDKKTGYLWETGGSDDIVNVYDLKTSTSPIETFPGTDFPYAISIQSKGKPKGETVISDIEAAAVYAYKPGQYTSYATLSNGVELPTGLLIKQP